MYEDRHTQPLPPRRFARRTANQVAGFFALYAGVVFLVVAGLFLSPVIHRIMHKFHWEGSQR